MQRVMLIDDDVIIRKGLGRNIAWQEHGFELAGEAGDGEEGLRLFEAVRPAIVISDIKMPFMDGLEMARRLLARAPGTKIILLTGYEEFDYAKQALQLQVFDYILKPVDHAKLLETVQRAAAALEKEEGLRRQVLESKPLLVQRFLTRLIHGWYPAAAAIGDEAAFLGIDLGRARFIVLAVKIDEYCNPRAFAGVYEQETAKLEIAGLCREQLAGSGYVLDSGGDELVLICGRDLKPGAMIQAAAELGEAIRAAVNETFGVAVTVGIGSARSLPEKIAASYRDAKAATEFRHIYGKNQVLISGETGAPAGREPDDLFKHDADLALQVKLGLTEEALALLKTVEARLLERYVSLAAARLVGLELAVLCLKEAEPWQRTAGAAADGFFFECCRAVQEGQTVAEIFDELRRLVTAVTGLINGQRELLQAGVVGQAVRYIEENYPREGLTLSELAQAVHVSPVYLSVIFKKERGINFSDFLTEIRLKKAMELLRGTDLKTYEVAERVGYSNPRYFSACFKRYTGYSPSDFKAQ